MVYGKSLETGLVLKALDFAMKKVEADADIIFHSDRGSQYTSKAYRNILEKKSIKPVYQGVGTVIIMFI